MSEILLNILTICVFLALLIVLIGFAIRLLKGGWRILSFAKAILISDNGPNPKAVNKFSGRIVDSRNWHGNTDGRLYSEFWLRTVDGLERRYKLRDTHPNLRKGHRVKLYEYAGTLVYINNDSTGIEDWVIPEWLLTSLYPTGRFRRALFWGAGLWSAYYLLRPSNPNFEQVFLFLTWVAFIGITGAQILKHVLTASSRRIDRLSEFSIFCHEATRPH